MHKFKMNLLTQEIGEAHAKASGKIQKSASLAPRADQQKLPKYAHASSYKADRDPPKQLEQPYADVSDLKANPPKTCSYTKLPGSFFFYNITTQSSKEYLPTDPSPNNRTHRKRKAYSATSVDDLERSLDKGTFERIKQIDLLSKHKGPEVESSTGAETVRSYIDRAFSSKSFFKI